MTSNHHALYVLGYTRATMVGTKSGQASDSKRISKSRSQFGLFSATREHEVGVASNRRSECFAGECVPGLVHTARHTMGVGNTRSRRANRKEADAEGRVNDWGEVVTR